MEKTEAAAKVASSVWEQLIHAPSHLLLLVVLLALGVLIKKSPTPNWLIPWLLVTVGSVGYPFLASPGNVDPSFPNPALVLRIYGGLLGIGAIVAHIFLKKVPLYVSIENGIVNAFREDEDKTIIVDPKKDVLKDVLVVDKTSAEAAARDPDSGK